MEEEKEEEGSLVKKIKVGVCVMEKKVKCGSEVLFLLLYYIDKKKKNQ